MRYNLLLQILTVGLLVAALYVTPALTQWSTVPNFNNAICTATGDQRYPTIVSDGSGGAIITWQDARGSDVDIYVQRVNASGAPQWTANGVAICTATGDQTSPNIASDGSGGAIIIWQDGRGSDADIYAQRVNASGAPQWTANGVAICAATGGQYSATIGSDGSGGAIITWTDGRNGIDNDIYAQRVNASGAPQWTANGVAICAATGNQQIPTIVPDGSGGAIITWQDTRGSDADIYAQRVNASGAVQWTANGAAICTATGSQMDPTIVSDGSGGAIITWYDYRNASDYDIYAQRVNASGAPQWTANGVAICTATSNQYYPTIVSDGSGGAIITWADRRGSSWDVYAQRVNASGAVQWTANGVAICTATGDQTDQTIVSDGSGGAIITWQDLRGSDADIYAQRVNASGAVQWTANGAAICAATRDQMHPTIVSDGSGGAIITWFDQRSGNNDIYAQKVDVYCYLGNVAPQISSVKDIVNDQGGKVTVSWTPSYVDVYPNTTIKSYYLFRGVSQTMQMKAMKGPGDFLKEIASGTSPKNVLLKTPRSAQGVDAYYWEYIDSVRALRLPGYSYTMPTVSDSGPQGKAMCYAMVMARTGDELTYWFSIPDSGYSVDNLPPFPVIALAAQPEAGPSVNVHWNKDITDPDVGYYEVHRSTTDGFIPGPSTKIGQTSDTTLVDASPSAGAMNYYRIVTVDIHGNKSTPSGQASVEVTVTNRYSVSNRWNLVSVPLTTSDYTKSGLYPTAVSSAFTYHGGYTPEGTLVNGVGYWLKFNGGQSVGITGLVRTRDSISVQAGWNLIGSISSPVAVTGVGSSPAGIIASQFFGYSSGYHVTDSIQPGKGYWVKVNQSGKLILASAGELVPETRIRIVSGGENPPTPPDGEVAHLTSEIPNQFTLQQNYPNPFNPTTDFQFSIASLQLTTLRVYDVLGKEVATLVNEIKQPGEYRVTWDATNMPSGLYFYKLTAGTYVEVKKMLMLK